MDTTLLIILATISGIVLGWLTFYFNSKRQLKEDLKDGNNQTIKLAEFKIVLDNIKSTTEDTRLDVKEINRSVTDMNTRLIIVERDVKKAHERIDNIKKA